MGAYVKIGDVNTWYDEEGSGDSLVLFHGGLSTNETWAAQIPRLAESFRVVAPERRGHGHTADSEGPLSYDLMAQDMIGFLDTVVGGPAHIVGWSDGGIVGLIVAMDRPDLVRKLIVISANFDTSGLIPGALEELASMTADSEDLAMFRAAYEAVAPDGPKHWPVVFAKFQAMVSTQPNITGAELARIGSPTLVLAGDDDMISPEHSLALYRAIPNSELALVPGTSHALMMEKPDLVNRLMMDFLQNEPAPTFMPFRRRPGTIADEP
jgi:pimeloyl-ACP methyl ester carboxylesterase